jgi:hypothetical protein
MGLASRRHGRELRARSDHLGKILGFCSGQARSCLWCRSLDTMAVSALGQVAVVWIPPSSSV